jgi:hypothetical protein
MFFIISRNTSVSNTHAAIFDIRSVDGNKTDDKHIRAMIEIEIVDDNW